MRFGEFLQTNGPWKLLIDEGRIELRDLEPDATVNLAPDLKVRCFHVPHRDEFSDTVGILIDGPDKRMLYLREIDKWEAFDAWTLPTSRSSTAVSSPTARSPAAG